MIPNFISPYFRHHWVRVKNASGAVIPPHSVVVMNGTVSTSDGEPVFSVIKPHNASTDFKFTGYLVTGPQAIGGDSSAEGWATTAWNDVPIAYNGSAPSAGAIYGPKHGQFTLEQYYYGFAITGGATTSAGVNVVMARWIGIHSAVGTIDDTNVSLGSTCTVSVMVGSSYQTDSGMNISGVVNRGTALTGVNGDYCKLSAPNGVPILDWVTCGS